MNRLDIAGRHAVVTGGASGIGLAVAEALIAEGMKVLLADIDAPKLRDVERHVTLLVAALEGATVYEMATTGLVSGTRYTGMQEEKIASLLRPKLEGKTGALGLERSIERVRSCGVLKDARAAELSAALAKVK